MIRAADISAMLARQAEAICRELLPNGKRQGHEWCVGSVQGEAGESLKVHLDGQKAGVWCDFASNQGGDLIDLWREVHGLSLREAIEQAKAYLGVRETRPPENPRKRYARPTREGVTALLPLHEQWLRDVRKISAKTIQRYKLASRKGALMFPYLREGELIAAKYRKAPAKEFFVDADCEPCLFGWHGLAGTERGVLLVEGEMDVLAAAEYGYAALSVPYGGGGGDKQAKWIAAEFDRLAMFDWLFIAMDVDATGAEAVDEIVSRLGRERCRVVTLPRKDLNACLMDGVPVEDITAVLNEAKTRDPEQLRNACEFEDQLVEEFSLAGQREAGIRLPWQKVEDRLILRYSELSLWTGINGHGKSQVVGHCTAFALAQGELACVASMEFKPVKWLKRLVRQIAARRNPSERYVRSIAHWWSDKLWVFDVTGRAKAGQILEVFAYAARRYGVRLFVIDNLAKCGFAEDDYNGQKDFIDALTDFAKEHDVHVMLVCHPRKADSEDKPSGKMDIKGSGGITDMADTVVSIWRNKPKERVAKKPEEARTAKDHDELKKPDALLDCSKQRNGEDEPTIALWFDQESFQFVENAGWRPKRLFMGDAEAA